MSQNAPAKGDQLKVELRRELVKQLIPRQFSQSAIATKLDVSRSTIQRDVEAIKARIRDETSNSRPSDFLAGIIINHEVILRELWKLADSTSHPNIKLGALKQISSQWIAHTELLYKLGFINEAVKGTPENLSFVDYLKRAADEKKARELMRVKGSGEPTKAGFCLQCGSKEHFRGECGLPLG
ncbi:MAG: HTH domain-containing protein [Candidatus Diapherotrites archaeon]|uniref:HTH domain-containing protein n=1 Tax=Candidatus Iainarchaeum sp. TaxID=3101447 RepID=A0A8T4LAF2_9ARCH|nr:HTH domain-containing protein [Candidatus Diapherotrites archaeon]